MTESERLSIFQLKNWKAGTCAPSNLLRGSSAAFGSVVYCNTSSSKVVYAYDSATGEWSALPDCPQQFFALAVVDGTLTAVGGFRGLTPTGALQSFVAEDGDDGQATDAMKWKEIFPPMPTKRGRVAALCAGRHLIAAAGQLAVVGGRLGPGVTVRSPRSSYAEDADNAVEPQSEGGYLRTVELLDTESRHWYSLASLPDVASDLSISLCGGSLYLLGGWSSRDRTQSVVTSQLQSLLKTASTPSTSSSSPTRTSPNPWHKVADLPVYASTTAVLYNAVLVAVGGFGDDEAPTDEVYSYEPSDNSWHMVGRMPTARYQALTATLPGNKLLVVGGYNSEYESTSLMEIGTVG